MKNPLTNASRGSNAGSPVPDGGQVMHIRPARGTEVSILSDLALGAKSAWGYLQEDLQRWHPQLTLTPEMLRDYVVNVAEVNGEVRGFYAIRRGPERWQLEHLWIDPRYWRRGIGRSLMSHALGTAVAHGAVGLEVESDPNAELFYRRLGARRIGSVPAPTTTSPGRQLPILWLDARPLTD
jgi:ribosomal protein S18 acetylase RimI-like enzyme